MQQQKNIFPCGALPPRFGEAFEAVARHLGFVRTERGERVQIEQGKNGLLVKKSAHFFALGKTGAAVPCVFHFVRALERNGVLRGRKALL